MPSSRRLGFLHTAETHVATFERLLAERQVPPQALHAVRGDLLQRAIDDGDVGDELTHAVLAVVQTLREQGAGLVICTCSTLGGCAEAVASVAGIPVMRLDRPMAVTAVQLGRRILVAACLPCTLGPTAALLTRVAWAQGKHIVPRFLLVESAWERFQAGDRTGYVAEIADRIRREAVDVDVVVLAQASMAPAAVACGRGQLAVPVLSSPRSGLAAALAMLEESR
jgi:hypothetical protein